MLWGNLDNQEVYLYTLQNDQGTQIQISNYGASVVRFIVKDQSKKPLDIVLGYDNLNDYLNKNQPHFGVTVGRFAGRICEGKFKLNDVDYQLDCNTVNAGTQNHLHGGKQGFSSRLFYPFPGQQLDEKGNQYVQLRLLSEDGDQGYPGTLELVIKFTLDNDNQLIIDYNAKALDKSTILSLTNHSYFNLKGQGNGDIHQHYIKINSDQICEITNTFQNTGKFKNVQNTPFDFINFRQIGERINDVELQSTMGYDHGFKLDFNDKLKHAATVYEDQSKLQLDVFTTEPDVQFYTGNFLQNQIGKDAQIYIQRGGFCLECQHFPDSVNKEGFPSVILEAGKEKKSQTIYKISLKN